MTVALDTLAIVRRLQAAGFPETQAEAVTIVIRDSLDADFSTLATKADLETLRLATKADMETLRLSTKADIEGLRKDFDGLRLSTKADIEGLRKDFDGLRKDFDGLRKDTRADIDSAKVDIIKWTVGMIGFQTLVTIGAVLALARLFVK